MTLPRIVRPRSVLAAARTLFAPLVVCLLVAGCSARQTGDPVTQTGNPLQSCVQVLPKQADAARWLDSASPRVAGLWWIEDGRYLIVQPVAGPATPQGPLLRVSFPDRTVASWVTPGSKFVFVGADGTVFWTAPDGVWALDPGAPAAVRALPLKGADDASVVEDLAITRDYFYVVHEGRRVDRFARGSISAQTAYESDPQTIGIWVSWDDSQVVVTKAGASGDHWRWIVTADETTSSVAPKVDVGAFKWLGQHGQQVVLYDGTRRLVSVPVGGPPSPSVVDPDLPNHLQSVTRPTSGGRIAYTYLAADPGLVCFATLPPVAVP